MAFVITRAVLVWLTEVTDHDGTIDRADDRSEGHFLWRTGQHVATADSTLGADQARALQREEDLFEVGLGERGSLSDVAY